MESLILEAGRGAVVGQIWMGPVRNAMKIRVTCMGLWGLMAVSNGFAGTIYVPGDYPSIQAGVDAAAAGDEIVVAPGIYTSTQAGHVVNMKGKAVTLRSSDGPEVTIIDGEGARRGVACFNAETAATIIDGFTITDGLSVPYDYDGDRRAIKNSLEISGGGVCCYQASLSIRNCVVVNNHTEYAGGGVSVYGGSIHVDGCTIGGNSAAQYGGGLYCRDGLDTAESGFAVMITNSMFENNRADWGGGLKLQESSAVVRGSTCRANTAVGPIGNGGAIHAWLCSKMELDGCEISDNQALGSSDSSYGGGITIDSVDNVTIDNCLFSGNISRTWAGGLIMFNGLLDMNNCVFEGNQAQTQDGGGFYAYENSGSVTSCSFQGGSAGDSGGGMYFNESMMNVSGCELINNTAGIAGGGICSEGLIAPDISDTTLCGNMPTAMTGPWSNGGGVCRSMSCEDSDDNGTPDWCEGTEGDGIFEVPGEYGSIQQAIDAADHGDTVLVGPGRWTGGGDPVVDPRGKWLTIRSSHGADATVLDGEGEPSIVVCTSGETAVTLIEGFTITSNQGGSNNNRYLVVCDHGSPTISQCRIIDSQYSGMRSVSSQPIVRQCLIQNNSGSGVYGYDSTLTLVESIIKANQEGGLQFGYWSELFVSDCVFTGNFNDQWGGAIGAYDDCEATIRNTVFENNVSEKNGGAVYYGGWDAGLIEDSLFIGNQATLDGGGLYVRTWELAVRNCEFRSNNAGGEGGGIHVFQQVDDLELEGSIVCGNSPSQIYGSWVDQGGNEVVDSCPICADVTGDGVVDLDDVIFLLADWGKQDSPADFDGDGQVDVNDVLILLDAYGTSC